MRILPFTYPSVGHFSGVNLTDRVHCMAKEETPPKKGPHRMATACKPENREEIADRELNAGIEAFLKRAHATIEEARGNMTDEEIAKADREAKAVLDRATSAAKSSRHSA